MITRMSHGCFNLRWRVLNWMIHTVGFEYGWIGVNAQAPKLFFDIDPHPVFYAACLRVIRPVLENRSWSGFGTGEQNTVESDFGNIVEEIRITSWQRWFIPIFIYRLSTIRNRWCRISSHRMKGIWNLAEKLANDLTWPHSYVTINYDWEIIPAWPLFQPEIGERCMAEIFPKVITINSCWSYPFHNGWILMNIIVSVGYWLNDYDVWENPMNCDNFIIRL